MSRLMRVLKKLALAAGVLLMIALLANVVLVWVTGSRLEDRLAALRAAGQPVVLTDLQLSPLDADQDAATYLNRARDDQKAFAKETLAIQSKPEYGADELNEADLKTLRTAFDAYPKLVPLLEQAANCPDYRPALDYAAGPDAVLVAGTEEAQRFRAAVNVLDARARLLTAEGKSEEALSAAVTMFRLAKHLEREPMMIGNLLLIACRAVAGDAAHRAVRLGPVSAKLRDSLDVELAAADDSRAYVFSLRSERALGTEFFRAMSGNVWFTRAYVNDNQSYLIDVLNRMVELADRPNSEVQAFQRQWQQQSGSLRHALSKLVLSAVFSPRLAWDRSAARLRCLRVINALQRRGGEPALADLGLPAAATTDPFTGEPLHVKKTAEGWLVYAVGEDLKDDGGQVTRPESGGNPKDIGFGPIVAKAK
ncbi:MAG: hypothetical protein ACJ8F7_06220 [Gemmataceae bacterium]